MRFYYLEVNRVSMSGCDPQVGPSNSAHIQFGWLGLEVNGRGLLDDDIKNTAVGGVRLSSSTSRGYSRHHV